MCYIYLHIIYDLYINTYLSYTYITLKGLKRKSHEKNRWRNWEHHRELFLNWIGKVTKGIKSRFVHAEETICELENWSFEMVSLRSRERVKLTNTHIMGVPEGAKGEEGSRNWFFLVWYFHYAYVLVRSIPCFPRTLHCSSVWPVL